MTVRGYLAFVAALEGRAAQEAASRDRPGVPAHRHHPRSGRLILALSKGYRQRVGLAQALLGSPPVLILDEPTEGLDPRQRTEVLELIKALAGQHTVILSTHILPEVKATCQKVLIIHRGKMVAHDEIAKLTDQGRESGLEEMFIQLTAA